jgi:hypothetical protein
LLYVDIGGDAAQQLVHPQLYLRRQQGYCKNEQIAAMYGVIFLQPT